MDDTKFQIIFEKLAEYQGAEVLSADAATIHWASLNQELDAVRELRLLALDVADPPMRMFTST